MDGQNGGRQISFIDVAILVLMRCRMLMWPVRASGRHWAHLAPSQAALR
jgi:hypothetical protein